MKRIWIHKAKSFKEANEFDFRYYLGMSPSERIETIQFLREIYLKLHPARSHGKGRKGLRGFIKILQ